MLNEYKLRLEKPDWGKLHFDSKRALKSWIRNTEDGLKSLKVEVIVQGSMENVLRVMNENHKYRHIYDASFESQRYL